MYMPVYEKHLTLEELKAVAAFYESPVGKNIKRLHWLLCVRQRRC